MEKNKSPLKCECETEKAVEVEDDFRKTILGKQDRIHQGEMIMDKLAKSLGKRKREENGNNDASIMEFSIILKLAQY